MDSGKKGETATPRRRNREETRRRVLDAVVATVVDVGYYTASSNEIARRADVTWGTIQHLFGSREQLMLDVVNDIGMQIEQRFADSDVNGATLEERLTEVLNVLSLHYEQSSYLVQVQILLDLSANPKMSSRAQKAIRRDSGQVVDRLAQPLMEKALGDVAAEHDLVMYAFMTMRGYLISCAVAQLVTTMPRNSVVRLIGTGMDEKVLRRLMVRGVTETIRKEATLRGYSID
jgi:AcrR family transcriptional regulator